MSFFTRPELIDEQFKQLANTKLTLYGETDFQGVLKSKGIEIDASTGGTVSIGDVLTLDSDGVIRLKSSASGNTNTYQGASPATITVGGISAGTVLTGKTFEQLWEELLVVYQEPTFSVFNLNISLINQVGDPAGWSGIKTFTWSTTNSGNVQPNTIEIIDVTNSNTVLGSGLANDGSEDLNLGVTINNNVPITHTWGIRGTNTESNPISQKNYTITSIYPWFYGTYASGGAPSGSNRPDPSSSGVAQSLIDSGTVIVASSNGTIIVNNFNATADDYIWFAVPTTYPLKTIWYVNALDNGAIGGVVSPAGNLFPDPTIVLINSPSGFWNNVQYRIYVSNKQVNSTYMEFRNN